jgi:hypothetical protein
LTTLNSPGGRNNAMLQRCLIRPDLDADDSPQGELAYVERNVLDANSGIDGFSLTTDDLSD